MSALVTLCALALAILIGAMHRSLGPLLRDVKRWVLRQPVCFACLHGSTRTPHEAGCPSGAAVRYVSRDGGQVREFGELRTKHDPSVTAKVKRKPGVVSIARARDRRKP